MKHSDYKPIDVKHAFNKLLANTYFDNNDLFLRNQIAIFLHNDPEKTFEQLSANINRGSTSFTSLFQQISLRLLPKKIDQCDSIQKDNIPQNFLSNYFSLNGSKTKRLLVFCSLPVELHIVCVLWIMKYGFYLDKTLNKSCLGNRLILTKGKLNVKNRSLFKPYIKQFKKWWSGGINEAEKLLKANEDVTIINFDLKDYYHSIEFDFEELEAELKALVHKDVKEDPLHQIFKQIHFEYTVRIRKLGLTALSADKDKCPLPIGVLSSYILGNWYLRKFDQKISSELIPTYYGRYVDDILIVLKGRLIKTFDNDAIKDLEASFLANGIKSTEKGTSGSEQTKNENHILNYFVYKYLSGIFTPFQDDNTINYRIRIEGLNNLKLQQEKFFIYQFDAELSPNLISKFVEEQKERSSEFRFLSDEEDETFDDFNDTIFESNFENSDVNKARFKQVEENKFKLSVYLAKIIKRRIEKGLGYKNDDIDKIEKYFQGIYVLRNYYFWEKLFTLYLVADKKHHFIRLINHINKQINSMLIDIENINPNDVKQSLKQHLRSSLEMALGLNPTFYDDDISQEVNEVFVDNIDPMRFRRVSLLRKQYIFFPLLQLTSYAKENEHSLVSMDMFENQNLIDLDADDFDIEILFVPYRIKFYETALFTFIVELLRKCVPQDRNHLRWVENFVISSEILDKAFHLFYNINNPFENRIDNKRALRRRYFQPYSLENGVNPGRIPNRDSEVEIKELYIPESNSGNPDGIRRIAIVNKYVSWNEDEQALDGHPNRDEARIETLNQILDEIGRIRNCDLFVQPEISLPIYFVYRYLSFSARNQIGFITGIEHIRIFNLGFNFVLTCLPINIEGDRDAVPIFRLKNHYAPEEESKINEKYMVVPKPQKYLYHLFEWRNLYFSSYYCFELADIFHRSALFSMVDLIAAPIWNKDTHYYNSLIESATRDLHCYMVQVNTSQYGETRLSRPTGHVRRDKARVKGGTTVDYKVTFLVSDIKIDELRLFQRLRFEGQKELNRDDRSFKPTPPDFPYENVEKRINNERFGNQYNELQPLP